ncbi:hypothetical protein HD806DRAFT_296776 [Xylariaceae sp. AK1471]|nr:hypothetical protein HD806DRAFT_296776 [Xylariaceae sp. AK1471]
MLFTGGKPLRSLRTALQRTRLPSMLQISTVCRSTDSQRSSKTRLAQSSHPLVRPPRSAWPIEHAQLHNSAPSSQAYLESSNGNHDLPSCFSRRLCPVPIY